MTARILRGDVRAMLDTLPDESVQMVVTSPPYWGLRSYLPEGHPDKHLEIGSEATVDEWVETMVDVFRRVRRVLRDDGVLFLNLGDSYVSGQGGRQSAVGELPPSIRRDRPDPKARPDLANAPAGWAERAMTVRTYPGRDSGLKPKDLIGQLWLAAFALRADGWWLRQEIIWAKPAPMPESVRDRCTKAHEHVFLLTKGPRYFWNFDAVQEPVSGGAHARVPGNKTHGKHAQSLAADRDGEHRTKGGLVAYAERQRSSAQARPRGWASQGDHSAAAWATADRQGRGGKTPSSAVTPKAAAGAERGYAEGEAARMAEVGVGGLVDTRNPRSVWTIPSEPFKGAHYATYPTELARRCVLAGSRPGDVVLDPFGGSGTTAAAADQLGRDSILIDLDERNVSMARSRIAGGMPLLDGVLVETA